MDLKSRLLIACLGALSPILASLLVLDLNLMLANASLLETVSYIGRQLALCIAACIVVYLSPDAKKPLTIFQLGIAAPALLIGIINGASQSHNLNLRVEIPIPSITTTARAQSAPRPGNSLPSASQFQVADCLRRDSTVLQQIARGAL